MTKAYAKRLRTLITRYTQAAIEQSWIGARDPDEHVEIRETYRKAKAALEAHINAGVGDPQNGNA